MNHCEIKLEPCLFIFRPLLENIAEVMDEEAEGFVLKLWRFLIYETEAKRQGV